MLLKYVVKRSGKTQPVWLDKIQTRINRLCYDNLKVDVALVVQHVIPGLQNGMKSSEIDEFSAEIAVAFVTEHPDYARLAARISKENLHRETPKKFDEAIKILRENKDVKTMEPAPLIAEYVYDFIIKHANELNEAIVHSRDEQYDYFGLKTLKTSYLLRSGGAIIERPQCCLMRVACGLHIPPPSWILEEKENTEIIPPISPRPGKDWEEMQALRYLEKEEILEKEKEK